MTSGKMRMNEDLSRTEAQQRADDIHVFRREL